MPFPFDKYPWLNFHELNLAYFIMHFREIFQQWDTLLHEMYDWKDATDAELAEWKSTVETGISSWETGLQQSMEDWKDQTEADISNWEGATLTALDTWKTATTAVFEQIRTEAAASATAAAGSAASAQTALSGAQAAQAAAETAAAGIQSELAQIQTNTADIADLKTQLKELVKPQNFFNGAFWNVDGYITISGTFAAATGYKTTNAIFLNAGNYLFNLDTNGYGSDNQLSMETNSDGTPTGQSITAVNTGESFLTRYTIFSIAITNAGYYRFNAGRTATEYREFMIVIGSSASDFPDEYVPYSESAQLVDSIGLTSTMQSETNALIQAKTDPIDEKINAIAETIPASANLFNGNFWESDGYFAYNGNYISATGYKTTDAIYLTAGNYLFNLNTAGYGGDQKFAETNSEGTPTGTSYTASDTGSTFLTDYTIFSFTVSSDGYYRFNAGRTITEYREFMIIRGSSASDFPEEYIPYREESIILRDTVPLTEKMNEEVTQIPFPTKKIAADGDSISYGNGYIGGYAKIISENNNMNYQNLSVGGGTIAAETYQGDPQTPRHWICRSMANIDSDADYILIEGGVNDASLGVTLGELSTGFEATLDDTTFYGAMETVCKTLTTQFVGKKYAFIIPHGAIYAFMPEGAYYEAVIECCEKWGVPIINIQKYAPPFNQFRHTTIYDTIRSEYTTAGDGWHPTELCYRKYYVPKITEFMRSL